MIRNTVIESKWMASVSGRTLWIIISWYCGFHFNSCFSLFICHGGFGHFTLHFPSKRILIISSSPLHPNKPSQFIRKCIPITFELYFSRNETALPWDTARRKLLSDYFQHSIWFGSYLPFISVRLESSRVEFFFKSLLSFFFFDLVFALVFWFLFDHFPFYRSRSG